MDKARSAYSIRKSLLIMNGHLINFKDQIISIIQSKKKSADEEPTSKPKPNPTPCYQV